MVYNFENSDNEVPSLDEFTSRLAKQMLRSAFFQDEKKENFEMTNIPIIIAPKLLKQQVNSDSDKKTLFHKKFAHGPESFSGLAKLINRNQIDITDLDSLSPENVKNISKDLNIKKISSKNKTRLLEEIKFLCEMYVAGQGNLHLYILYVYKGCLNKSVR